jgi:dihydroorotase
MIGLSGRSKNYKNKRTKNSIIPLFAQKIENEIKAIDEKLEKLMNVYLENDLSLEEYQETKNRLVNQKQLL